MTCGFEAEVLMGLAAVRRVVRVSQDEVDEEMVFTLLRCLVPSRSDVNKN